MRFALFGSVVRLFVRRTRRTETIARPDLWREIRFTEIFRRRARLLTGPNLVCDDVWRVL